MSVAAEEFEGVDDMRNAVPLQPDTGCVNQELIAAVSFVIPCHNEEANVRRLTMELIRFYDCYIHEIIIVDDNSTDRTAEVTRELSEKEPRIRLVRRTPPAGVGGALRDGYAAATGRFILSMDCDFVEILPEFRNLFDAVGSGCDGAIGSRFSPGSRLVRYPWPKKLANRGFHLLLNLFLGRRIGDISNNLKLYRAEILRGLRLEESGFAANAETGLKPLLAGYRIREVPVSWIGRGENMGASSFKLLRVGPGYFRVMCRMIWRRWSARYKDVAIDGL
jgi:glycosyltransferase involved in cell wall biosynthesis